LAVTTPTAEDVTDDPTSACAGAAGGGRAARRLRRQWRWAGVHQQPARQRGNTVVAKRVKFSPAAIEVPAGTEVTWSFQDGPVPHDVKGDGWDSGDPQRSGTFSRTFDQPRHRLRLQAAPADDRSRRGHGQAVSKPKHGPHRTV
jgi:plastocyanin